MGKPSLFKILIALMLISGCVSAPNKAPIVDATPLGLSPPKSHIVSPGETLYSIALKYDLDYKKISKINDIEHPFAIHPGQRLTLDTSLLANPVKKAKKLNPKALNAPVSSSKYNTLKRDSSGSSGRSSGRISWVWPVNGKVLGKFSSYGGLNKGIDIHGKLRESVVAAAEGVVVYSGSGLRGYGQLIIVKHSENLLSAYAHNEEVFVRQGDQVKAGQLIARLGGSDSDVVKLHFEIRLNGKPVDPLRYLPRR